MQFSTTIFAMLSAISAVTAVSLPERSTINLDNGDSTISAKVESAIVLSRNAGDVNCHGSARCNNGQSLKNGCAAARERIMPTVYKNGGE